MHRVQRLRRLPRLPRSKASGKTRILNSYDFGGYLIFNHVAPFIDGRTELYGKDFMLRHDRAVRLQDVDGFLRLLADYRIDATLLTPNTPANGLLDRLKGWTARLCRRSRRRPRAHRRSVTRRSSHECATCVRPVSDAGGRRGCRAHAAIGAVGAYASRGPHLTVVVPTRNERDNIIPLYNLLCATLNERNWEMMVVDDDSADGTAEVVRWLGQHDRRVRLLSRIGRRGLASAFVEGVQASTAPYVAVIDADLQHDETLLPRMLTLLEDEPVDIVVGSRYVEAGGIGDWDEGRARISAMATRLGRKLLHVPVNDPMSGFFMIRREAFAGALRNLSSIGFKILIDLFASSPEPLRARELPFEFRTRHSGESKFDAMIGIEYLMLLADKLIGHIVPVRFLMFAAVGGSGLVTHLAVLWAGLNLLSAAVRRRAGERHRSSPWSAISRSTTC